MDRLVELHFPGVYFNPARWPTADGFIPFPVFPRYVDALFQAMALERLNSAQSVGMALAPQEKAKIAWDQATAEAYPMEG